MIGKFLVAWMTAESAVTAILGSSPLRFWRGTVPEEFRETWPRGTFQELADEDITEELDRPGNVWRADYQLQFANRGAQSDTTLQTLKAAIVGTQASPKLHRYTGGTLGGVRVHAARLTNSLDNATPPDEGSGYTIYELWLDFSLWYVRE